jgi:hypothetical protein
MSAVRFQIRQIGNQYSVVDSHTGKTWYSGPSLRAPLTNVTCVRRATARATRRQ